MLLPIGVFAQAMALAVFPTLSLQAAEKNLPAMRKTMNQSLRNILFLTVPASALMFLLAEPIITLLLQSGKYTHADTLVTAAALRSLSLGIFAWSCQSLLTRGFYALQNSKVPVISGAIVSVIFVVMNYAVVRPVIRTQARVSALAHDLIPLQASAALLQSLTVPSQNALSQVSAANPPLPDAQTSLTQLAAQIDAQRSDAEARLAAQQAALDTAQSALDRGANRAVWELGLTTTLAAAIHMLALFFLLRRRLTGLHTRRLLASLLRIGLATVLLCGVTLLLKAAFQTFVLDGSSVAPKLSALSLLLVAGLGGIGTFVFAARALKMPELQSAIDLVRRKRS
jgi:peptidoglycan biosynthesis protein MviN/MurJ (putative lipid II flippase)